MKLVSCVGWLKAESGTQTEKIKLDTEQLNELVAGTVPESSDVGGEEDAQNEDDTPEMQDGGDAKPNGLRGSLVTGELTDQQLDEARKRKKKKKRKDQDQSSSSGSDSEEEQIEAQEKNGMKGLAMFACANDDPYIQQPDDSSDEDEEYKIQANDSLLVTGKISKDHYDLVVHVYNAEEADFYVHHHYLLKAPPICLCPIGFDPGSETPSSSSLFAVGAMNTSIDIWDVKLINAMEPVCVLGEQPLSVQSKKPKKKKKSAVGLCHSDAVMCVAWNAHLEHILASGSADKSILFWDIENAKADTKLEAHTDKVQSLVWHPIEANLLLSGGYDSKVMLWDARMGDTQVVWNIGQDQEVEQCLWNTNNPFTAFVATSTGHLHLLDTRKPDEMLFTLPDTHTNGAVAALSLSSGRTLCKLLVTGGESDSLVKFWHLDESGTKLQNNEPIGQTKHNLGGIHAALFNADQPHILALAGDKGDYVQVINVLKNEKVKEAFGV